MLKAQGTRFGLKNRGEHMAPHRCSVVPRKGRSLLPLPLGFKFRYIISADKFR